jgi:hypothetical protein
MNSAPRFALIFGSAASLVLAPHLKAESATFDFRVPTNASSSSQSVTVEGSTFTLSNPIWTSTTSIINGIRQNPLGVCVWASIGTQDGRCNVNPADSSDNIGAKLSGLSGSVSKTSFLKSFTIGQYAGTISNASIQFKLGNTVLETLSINSTGLKTLSTPILLAAGQNLQILTFGDGPNPNNTTGSSIRISTFDIDTAVPGPLPLLGASAAFGWSRKLRRQVKKAQTI